MTWYPIAFLPPQLENSQGVPYSGAVLKAYAAGTTTNIPMATDYTGVTTAGSMVLNASGYPTQGGAVVIPHLQQNYKLALYPTQTAADANSGAIWTVDYVQIAATTNSAFIQYFDGDGVTATFTLSQNFGTDENILMVFADRSLPNYITNGDFATDTIWSKGAGWTIGAGVATATGAISTALSQNANSPIVQGQSYTVEFTVTASVGTVTPSVGGNSGTTRGAGTFRETIVAGSTQVLAFTGVGFTGTIDNVSIKEVTSPRRVINRPDEYTLNGNQLTLNNIPPSGTKNVIVFAPSLLLGAANNAAAAAATSEANALTYANNASASATAASGSATAAAASYDSFDDRYLGSKAADPTIDNDGNALLVGALYWNSVSNTMKVYNGSVWSVAYVGAGGFLVAANNLNDVSSAATSRSNLGAAASGANNDITSLGALTVPYAPLSSVKIPQSFIAGFLPTAQTFTSSTVASMTISAGQATDSTNASLLSGSSLSWNITNGNAANGYQGGTTLPNSSTIHFYAIATAADTTWSACFASTSLTPTLPATYTKYRRLFSIKTNGSGVLYAGTVTEVEGGAYQYTYTATLNDVNVATLGTSRTSYAITVPTGFKVRPQGRFGSATANLIIVSDLAEADDAPADYGRYDTGNGAAWPSSNRFSGILTDTSGQIGARGAVASMNFAIYTRGYVDFRR